MTREETEAAKWEYDRRTDAVLWGKYNDGCGVYKDDEGYWCNIIIENGNTDFYGPFDDVEIAKKKAIDTYKIYIVEFWQ